MPMHNPPHPGEMIKEVCLPSLGLTIKPGSGRSVRVAAGTVEPHPRAGKHHGRYGHPSCGGVRIVARDMAWHATRIRSVAGTASTRARQGQEVLAEGEPRGSLAGTAGAVGLFCGGVIVLFVSQPQEPPRAVTGDTVL